MCGGCCDLVCAVALGIKTIFIVCLCVWGECCDLVCAVALGVKPLFIVCVCVCVGGGVMLGPIFLV